MNSSDHLKNTITQDKSISILKNMMRIRSLEEESARLYTEQKIRGFLHLYIGQEAIASTVIPLLTNKDQIFATYREHAHALIRGISMKKILAEMFGKKEGCSKGRGGSMHLFDKSLAFYGGNAIVAGHIPMATGMALANKMQDNDLISVCFFGEGAMAEGAFHESINIASLWNLPILFICENNYYAMGTALERSESNINLVKKVNSYQVEASRVNGMSVSKLHEKASTAIDYVRKNQRPYFLECETYRFNAHSMFDSQAYRSKKEVEYWKKFDPIKSFISLLIKNNWLDSSELELIQNKIDDEINEAIQFAEDGTFESIEEVLSQVIKGDIDEVHKLSSSTP